MKTFTIFGAAVIILLLIWLIFDFFSFRRKNKSSEYKIRLLAKNQRQCILWIAISVLWIMLSYSNYRSALANGDYSRASAHIIVLILWVICLLNYLLRLLFFKYVYITEKGMIIQGAIGSVYKKENCRYKIDNNVLEIYYKNQKKSLSFGILKNKNELIEMLENNYEKYTDSEKN